MVDIFGGWGRIRTWINKRIRIENTANLFVGEDSGKATIGNYNNFIGYYAGYSNVAGHSNNFIGYKTGLLNVGGYRNNFMGYHAGYFNATGHSNNFMGHRAGFSNAGGYHNNFMGYEAGYSNVDGYHNVFIGHKAGYYETGNLRLFIDSLVRADEADSRIKSLIYGIFDAATANQLVRLNAILQLTEIKNGATQAGAGAAANEVWKTNGHASLADNVLMIGV